MRFRLSRLSVQVLVILSFLSLAALRSTLAATAADTEDCLSNGPLLSAWVGSGQTLNNPLPLGEWRLPVSSLRPDVLTAAEVQLELIKNSHGPGWVAQVRFDFPDPKPFGIPFTFQKAALSWTSDGHMHTAAVDWSERCSGPGRSLYPGQTWSATFDLGADPESTSFENPVFLLWGSRN